MKLQAEVNYRRGRRGLRCVICPHFRRFKWTRKNGGFNLEGRCVRVDGSIGPNQVCDLYKTGIEPKPPLATKRTETRMA